MKKHIFFLISMALLIIAAMIGCKKITDITLQSELFLAVGKTATLTVTITPENASNQALSWKTSNSSVATVEGGVVTGVAIGRATITVTTEDGNYSAKCFVTVLQPIEPEMVLVERGTFTMGCSDDECRSNELPNHEVALSSFNIGKYTVTQKEWKSVMDDLPSLYFVGDDIPISNITFESMQVFITRLNAVTGKNYRLPTEAEWEYAARGGNKSEGFKYSGSDDVDLVAWYDGNSGNIVHPVGKKQPNELGIYDMSGNVFEFCSDWLGNYTNEPQTNPTGPSEGTYRVPRGGVCYADALSARVSTRGYLTSDRREGRGFRLVHPE